MKLTRIEGTAAVLHCDGCHRDGIGGTESYPSASTGETREPEEWYTNETEGGQYCSTCAAKLVEIDPTRSISQFYSDTTGTEIATENL